MSHSDARVFVLYSTLKILLDFQAVRVANEKYHRIAQIHTTSV